MFLVVDSVCVCVLGGGGGGGGVEHACVFVIFALLVTDVFWDLRDCYFVFLPSLYMQ